MLLLFTGITVPLAGPDNSVAPPPPPLPQPPDGMVSVAELQQELHPMQAAVLQITKPWQVFTQ